MYTYTSVSGKLAKEAIQGHSGQMSSKTKLVGLGIFRCGNEKSVHGRPSWELGLHDCSSQITADFASRYKLGSKECHFSERARECRVVHFSTQFFILDKAKALINLDKPPPPPATINYIILSLTFDLKSEYTSILLLVWV